MVSLRPSSNTFTEEPISLTGIVYGDMSRNQNPLTRHKDDHTVSRSIRKKFLAFKPRLLKSFSVRRCDAQLTKFENNESDNFNIGSAKKQSSKKVRFRLDSEIHLYEANPANDLGTWWISEELHNLRKDSIAKETDSIKDYLIAYKRAFRESQTNDKVAAQNMADLVLGLDKGHRGLELFTSLQQVERKSENRSVVASVVDFHRKLARTNVEPSDLLCSHSVALTARSRHWAQALGRADMYAVNKSEKSQAYFLYDR